MYQIIGANNVVVKEYFWGATLFFPSTTISIVFWLSAIRYPENLQSTATATHLKQSCTLEIIHPQHPPWITVFKLCSTNRNNGPKSCIFKHHEKKECTMRHNEKKYLQCETSKLESSTVYQKGPLIIKYELILTQTQYIHWQVGSNLWGNYR